MPLICLGMETLSRTRVKTSAFSGFALLGKYLESLWVRVKYIIGGVEAVGRDLRVHLCGCVISYQRVADGRVHLRRGLVLAEVQRAQGRRDRRVGFCLCEGLVTVAVDL